MNAGATSFDFNSRVSKSLTTSAPLSASISSADKGCLLVQLELDGREISEKGRDIDSPVSV